MLNNWKIGARLYAAFAAIVGALLLLVGTAYRNVGTLNAANDMNVHTYQVIGEARMLLESLINIETGQRGFSLSGNEASLEPLNAGTAAFGSHLAAIRSLTADNPSQQGKLDEIARAEQDWLGQAIQPAIALRRQVVAGTASIDDVLVLERAGKGKAGMDAMRARIAAVMDAEEVLLKERAARAAALQRRTEAVLAIGGLLAALLAGLIAWWIAGNITRPLGEAVAIAERVARGDLTGDIDSRSNDEIGALLKALRDMNQSLVNIVGKVRDSTGTIATAAAEIASGNLDLSSRTEQQAGSLEETASSMEELTSTVRTNADSARAANDQALAASGQAQRGGEMIEQVAETMRRINDSSARVADIVAVIDSIAFQTNILALNAAVEAARAGEQGRGFAVVAGEVRALAHRAASAAKEIGQLINTSVEDVHAGSRLVDDAVGTVRQLVGSVQQVSQLIGHITAATNEQQAGIEQVNSAITQMDNTTQQNAALVEQAAAAAGSLEEQTGVLAGTVRVFTLPAGPAGAPSPREAPRSLPQLAR
ncbi:methyl-accepting chemotaxis protein [Pseudoduganella flava]|uniref:HAMP domain-containing protein n=1 Tax=Pseudoduganella flava TaxID=871742 RepID=A0A562Q0G9_9BURK|nr:methyl-accepting chemotaxis protein [Pseudoduganella flava]QGZ38282.1 HAMP domain-containing protein [Pseudoduganella flava]TWI50181.1 methyl-accepting chemotaxis protein [Pseudoduganella flava]